MSAIEDGAMQDKADDLVKRLLAPAYWMSGSEEGHEGENNAPREAAAELTRLRERNAELEKVLAGINVHRNALLRQNDSLEEADRIQS